MDNQEIDSMEMFQGSITSQILTELTDLSTDISQVYERTTARNESQPEEDLCQYHTGVI